MSDAPARRGPQFDAQLTPAERYGVGAKLRA